MAIPPAPMRNPPAGYGSRREVGRGRRRDGASVDFDVEAVRPDVETASIDVETARTEVASAGAWGASVNCDLESAGWKRKRPGPRSRQPAVE